jgi:hypothetical protein
MLRGGLVLGLDAIWILTLEKIGRLLYGWPPPTRFISWPVGVHDQNSAGLSSVKVGYRSSGGFPHCAIFWRRQDTVRSSLDLSKLKRQASARTE